jgi:hypothetical protein
MTATALEVRLTADRGRGLFALEMLPQGMALVTMGGWQARTAELCDDWLALQIDHDLWLCSHGDLLDDCGNHSCSPNAGFVTGEPILYALRDISAGEEICWDYSTSISYPGWTLECRCGSPRCRGTVLPWQELSASQRAELRGIALKYLRTWP